MPGQATVAIGDSQWSVAVASTSIELTGGLSGTASLMPGSGMLFDLGVDYSRIDIDMTLMLYPLDIVFISSDLHVVGVLRDVEPGEAGIAFEANGVSPARYFVEVNAGEAEGISIGEAVVITGYSQPNGFDMTAVLSLAVVVMLISTMGKVAFAMLKEPPAVASQLLPQTKPKADYRINRDRMGNVIITHSRRSGDVFLQFESDRQLIYDMLKKSERRDLDRGWPVEITDSEPRASILNELWDVAVTTAAKPSPKPAISEHTETLKQTRKHLRVDSWAERDRIGIWVTDERTGHTVAEWWDEAARQLFEDGFFKPGDIRQGRIAGKAFEDSVLDYVEYIQALPRQSQIVKAQKPPLSGNPAVIPVMPQKRLPKPDDPVFLPDSPEFLAYTIDDIGYRDKLDSAFSTAIARARRRQ